MCEPSHTFRTQLMVAENALAQLDKAMEAISFDPLVPSSVNAALKEITEVIPVILADFKGNPILASLASDLMTQYIDSIQEKVNIARLKST